MILPDKIMSLYNVRHGEGKPLLFLLLYGFVLGGALLFLDTVSYTLFLLRFDADRLPYVYLLVAVAGPLTGLLYARLEARLPIHRLLLVALFAMFLSLVACWGAVVWSGWRSELRSRQRRRDDRRHRRGPAGS